MNKFIVFSNHVDWGYITLRRFEIHFGAKIIHNLYPTQNALEEIIWRFAFSAKTSKFIPRIIKYILLRRFMKNYSIEQCDANIIFYDHNRLANNNFFLSELKKINPNLKFSYIFTNIVKYTAASDLNYVDKLNAWYDSVFAFDQQDAKKFGFSYSPLIYDPERKAKDIPASSNENMVFYVGQAKDRLPELIACFERLQNLNIGTNFHIANVKEDEKKHPEKISYNQFLTYNQCIDLILESTCLIDIIQGESTGLTIKVCEAIYYDKKLITTNKLIKDMPFYDSRYIKVISTPDDIDRSFFTENRMVSYSEDAKRYFSTEAFLERLRNKQLDK